MKYQIIEKEIYSEADVLHFGEKHEMGEIVNEYFPDYSGVQLGDVLFESEDIEKVKEKKEQFEIKRLKTLDGAINAFFDELDLEEKFYTTENFSKLKELYQKEYNLELIRRNYEQMEVKNNEFYIPSEATDEQVLQIQKLVGIYFFEIRTKNT